jgi:hypothetical protein
MERAIMVGCRSHEDCDELKDEMKEDYLAAVEVLDGVTLPKRSSISMHRYGLCGSTWEMSLACGSAA